MNERIRIRKTDIEVSRFCMGGCPMGCHDWGKVSKDELLGAAHAALDAGINFFDTADVYGMGESERILGEALGARRHESVILSKYGVRLAGSRGTWYDNSRQWAEQAVVSSLRRLNTDCIDIYLVHYRDGITPIEELAETSDRLRTKGYIRYFGFSNLLKQDIQEVRPYKDMFVTVQDEYSLAKRGFECDILELSETLDMTPLTWGSLGQGILTGKYDEQSVFGTNDRRRREVYVNFHGEKLIKNLKIVEAMRTIEKQTGKSLPAIALRFILDTIPGSVTLTGVKNRAQMEDNVQALDWSLSEEHICALNEVSK